MKLVITVLFSAFIVCYGESDPKCSWGSSYWCSSLQAAKSCNAIQHCKTSVWNNQQLKNDDAETCQFCKSIIDDVRKYISQQKTQAEIAQFMSQACAIIPKPSISAECKMVVETMSEVIIELVSAQINSQMICGLMHICTGLHDNVIHASVIHPSENNNQHADNKVMPPLKGIKSEPICTDCKKFFTDIKNMITSNTTQAQVEQMIDAAVCSLLGSLENECKTLVHEFLPELLQMIASYYDPSQICQSLGVCDSLSGLKINSLVLARLQRVPLYRAVKQSSAETCSVCKMVMTELQTLDRDKAVQQEILTFFKSNLCSKLGSIQAECELTVDLYGPELFSLLATVLDPETRCKSLGFCTSSSNSLNSMPMMSLIAAKPAPNVKVMNNKAISGPACELCQLVIQEVKSIVGQNATEQEIMDALEKVCSYLPSSLEEQCKSFVELYGKVLVELLLTELDPQAICTKLGLCDGVKNVPPPPKKETGTELCIICETIIQYLEALLEQNATIAEIEEFLDKICDVLPTTFKQTCEDVIKQYGDLILYYISTAKSPEEVCTIVHACDGKKESGGEEVEVVKKVNKLGDNECTWGPSYWCASRENADKCNAVEHCKRSVWKN